jgi:hypothetical protein
MQTMTATDLHCYADAIDHAAAIGGYVDNATGQRCTLTPPERQAWARDAAVLRQAAYDIEARQAGSAST